MTFVALDDARRPTPVPPLALDAPDDARRQAEAAVRREQRLARARARRA
jgi:acyl-CoA hydrolase